MAVVVIEARSEPMPGSVIAIAVISSPDAMPGNQRARCSSVQYRMKYGQADVVVQGDAEHGAARAGPLDLLHDHRVEPEVGDPAAPELLGHLEGQEPVTPRVGEHLAGDDAGLLPLLVVGDDLLLQPATEAGPQILVLRLEEVPAHG